MNMEKALRFLPVAEAVASLSKSPKRKVGAIILSPEGLVVATGFNDLSGGIPHTSYNYEAYYKEHYMVHAEENTITQAAKMGHATDGCTMLITGLPPCHVCARLIAQAGIKEVYYPKHTQVEAKWKTSFEYASSILSARGVTRGEF